MQMRRILLLLVFTVISAAVFSQKFYTSRNYKYKPKMDTTTDGIWTPSIDVDTVEIDSAYIEISSVPNNYDLGIVGNLDLELKYKSFWFDTTSTFYFLFRRLDDTIVNGFNSDGSNDVSVKDSLVNRDATAIYFYVRKDSVPNNSEKSYNADSITWLRFVWDSDTMEAQLPGGEIVNTFEEYHTEIIQWKSGAYHWAKLAIHMGEIAPWLFMPRTDTVGWDTIDNTPVPILNTITFDTSLVAFEVELNENDKEIEPAPFALQTRAYWGSDVGENALEGVSNWSYMYFISSSFSYTPPSSLKFAQQDFASVYPVPAIDQLTIHLDNYDKVNYSLYDLTGRLLISDQFEGVRKEINVSGLNSGTYIMRIRDSKGNYMTRKVLISY